MNKKAAMLLALCVSATLLPTTAMAMDQQDDFLKDLSKGLKQRWESQRGEKDITTYKKELVEQEYNSIKKYVDTNFDDEKFNKLVHSYIEAVELQDDSLQYYKDQYGIYESEWDAGYEIRSEILDIFTSKYNLSINTKDQKKAHKSGADAGTDVEPKKTKEDETNKNASQTQKKDANLNKKYKLVLYDNGEVAVKIVDIEENDFFLKIDFSVDNFSEQDIIVTNQNDELTINEYDVPSTLYVQAGAGKTVDATMTFDKKYAFVKEMTKEEKEEAEKKRRKDGWEPPFTHVDKIIMGIKVENANSGKTIYSSIAESIDVDADYNLSVKPMEVNKDTIKQVQKLLNAAGYDCGEADGISGPKLEEQIQKFTKDHGMAESKSITEELIQKLQENVN